MHLLLATGNPGKVIEISRALDGLSVHILTPKDLGISADVEESADTIEGNALLKARHYTSHGYPTLGDDSGIYVEALPGELGVKTRRWGLGAAAPDDEWIAYFLERMKREENKRARFVCILAYIDANGEEHLFEGIVDGHITETLEGSHPPGLPFDGCFVPDGYDDVFSKLTIEQKNNTSHRGRALQKFRSYVEHNPLS